MAPRTAVRVQLLATREASHSQTWAWFLADRRRMHPCGMAGVDPSTELLRSRRPGRAAHAQQAAMETCTTGARAARAAVAEATAQ
eukprot:13423415-Alexandrium_andersonii.AAC.1